MCAIARAGTVHVVNFKNCMAMGGVPIEPDRMDVGYNQRQLLNVSCNLTEDLLPKRRIPVHVAVVRCVLLYQLRVE